MYNVKLGIFMSKSCIDGNEVYKKAWCTYEIVVVVISMCNQMVTSEIIP